MGEPINGYRQLTEAEIKMINAVKGMCAGIHRTIEELYKGNHEAGEALYKALQERGARFTEDRTHMHMQPPDGATDAQKAEIMALATSLSAISPADNSLMQAAARLTEVEMWLVRAIAKPRRD